MQPIHVYSHGMGTDTCTMIKMAYDDPEARAAIFPKGYRHIVIFSDLGLEYPETYAQIEEQAFMVRAMGFEWVRLTPDMGYHPKHVGSDIGAKNIADWWQVSGCIGMTAGDKRCTDRWKVQPIWDWVSDQCQEALGVDVNRPHNRKKALGLYAQEAGPFRLTIGFAQGEERREAKTSKMFAQAGGWKAHVKPVFPLIEMGFSREWCNRYWEAQGLKAPRPSNCMFCFYQSDYELVDLATNHPEKWAQWEALEAAKIAARGGNGAKGVHTLGHYLDKAQAKIDAETGLPIGLLDRATLAHRVQYHGGCVKNAF